MDPHQFFSASRLVIVAGKGGVGKTTVTAALAVAAADAGLRTLVVEVEGKSGLVGLFGQDGELGYEEVTLASGRGPRGTGEVRARTISPALALVEYLEGHGLGRLSTRLARSGALDIVATAAPGIDDILVLGKVRQIERSPGLDLVVLDAPAAGHAIAFLQSPRGLVDAVQVGPIRTQAVGVLEMLSDAERCQVVLVTLPEETPVNELIDTAYALEDRVGVNLGPVVVNGLYPPLGPSGPAAAAALAARDAEDAAVLRAAAEFRRERVALQEAQVQRLARELPLPQIRLPFVFHAELGPPDVALLAAHLAGRPPG